MQEANGPISPWPRARLCSPNLRHGVHVFPNPERPIRLYQISNDSETGLCKWFFFFISTFISQVVHLLDQIAKLLPSVS